MPKLDEWVDINIAIGRDTTFQLFIPPLLIVAYHPIENYFRRTSCSARFRICLKGCSRRRYNSG